MYVNVEFASARWDTLYFHPGFPRAFPRIFCQEFNTLIISLSYYARCDFLNLAGRTLLYGPLKFKVEIVL